MTELHSNNVSVVVHVEPRKSHTSTSTVTTATTDESLSLSAKDADAAFLDSLSSLISEEVENSSEEATGLVDSQSTINSDASIYSTLITHTEDEEAKKETKDGDNTNLATAAARTTTPSRLNSSLSTVASGGGLLPEDDVASVTTLQTRNVPSIHSFSHHSSFSESGRWRSSSNNNSSTSIQFLPQRKNSIRQAVASLQDSWQDDTDLDEISGLVMDGYPDVETTTATATTSTPKPKTIALADGRSINITQSQGEQQMKKLQSFSEKPTITSVGFFTPFHPVQESGEIPLQEEEEEETTTIDRPKIHPGMDQSDLTLDSALKSNSVTTMEEGKDHSRRRREPPTKMNGMDQSDLTLDSALKSSSLLDIDDDDDDEVVDHSRRRRDLPTKMHGMDQSDLTVDSTLAPLSSKEEAPAKDFSRRLRDPDLEEPTSSDAIIPLVDSTTTTNNNKMIPTHVENEEPALLVLFRWTQGSCFRRALKANTTRLPPTVKPYVTQEQWQKLLQAIARLTFRNHKVGTIYMSLGMISCFFGLAYATYAIVPFSNKLFGTKMALGAGVGLLFVGACLMIWGVSNRSGGEIFEDDLEQLCLNASEQLPGLHVRFRSLSRLPDHYHDEVDSTLVFGIALYCSVKEEEEKEGEEEVVAKSLEVTETETTEDNQLLIAKDPSGSIRSMYMV